MRLGDRVKFIGGSRGRCVGEEGKIIKVLGSNFMWDYTVEFDKDVGGHSCYRQGKEGHCFWLYEHEIKLIESKSETPRESVMF